jgi:hypothetical protein
LVLLNSPENFEQFDRRVTIKGPSIRPFGATAINAARLVISISSNDRPLIAITYAPNETHSVNILTFDLR